MNTVTKVRSNNSLLLQQTAGLVAANLPDGSLLVQYSSQNRVCRQATSCLVMPNIGDTVLIADVGQQFWVIAVLERADPSTVLRLNVAGDLQIETPSGSLILHSTKQVKISSDTLAVQAQNADCNIDEMTYSGKEFSGFISVVRLVGKRYESLWHSIIQTSHTLFRRVRQIEYVRAGQLDLQAEDYARLHARNLIITSKNITKLDSEQIHIG
ncbi:DUF3540 domain-containing protein [Yersinia intermedia]|uniref:DUF3540 domain-containing protein n=1 Tax=Yersinia intermedia TaxID=631 RepID=UPI001F530FFA|nr:DUF3540 domain-containing protein [Yersinia intermedia]UNK24768.1 DUF3540 domain-containing protein [Yersinia intermedia]